MKNTNTDISCGTVRLNLQDLQETAKIAAGSLANLIIKCGEEIREKISKTPTPVERRDENFRISTQYQSHRIESLAKALVIAGRTLDAVYAADTRENVIVVK
jgi:hypothetical protein